MKYVSIVVPCHNEEKYIHGFMESVLANDYPREFIEILLVDGRSDDGTRGLLDAYASQHRWVRVIDNPEGFVSNAMNRGIVESSGEVIIRLDVHALYPTNYISTLVYYSEKLNADNVGGALETIPENASLSAIAISKSLSHPFGVGNSSFRLGVSDVEYLETDTVPFGCYKRSVFDKIGLYDIDLIRNQDNELNERLLLAGGKIFLVPSLKLTYFARGTYSKLWKMFYQYGYFGPLVDMKLGRRTRLRRYVPAIFVLSLILPFAASLCFPLMAIIGATSGGLHVIANCVVSLRLAFSNRRLVLAPYLFLAFLTAHLAYGIGYLGGFAVFRLMKGHTKNRVTIGSSR